MKKAGTSATYIAILEREEKGRVAVSFPDLPGVIAVDNTAREALELARELAFDYVRSVFAFTGAVPAHTHANTLPAIEKSEIARIPVTIALDVPGDDQEGVAEHPLILDTQPEREPVKVTISIDKDVKARLDTAAKEVGATRSGFITAAVLEYIVACNGRAQSRNKQAVLNSTFRGNWKIGRIYSGAGRARTWLISSTPNGELQISSAEPSQVVDPSHAFVPAGVLRNTSRKTE